MKKLQKSLTKANKKKKKNVQKAKVINKIKGTSDIPYCARIESNGRNDIDFRSENNSNL